MPKDCTQAVCDVYVRIFPSIVLYFCSNVFGFFILVASRMVFRATCSMRFLIFLSTVYCTPLYLKLSLFLASSIDSVYAPFSGYGSECLFSSFLGIGSCGTFCCFSFFRICTSSSDHRSRSCMTSAGNGGFSRFFRSKHACFAFSQFKFLGELFVAMFDNGVFGFLPICASKGENFVTPCGVILSVFVISATSEASLYGVFV